MPSSDPQSPQPVVEGIDVSFLQGAINWSIVAQSGIKFVYCKATEGIEYVDHAFSSYVPLAKAEGLFVGAYHVGHPNKNPEDEAKHFFSIAGATDLPPALDLELTMGVVGDSYVKWLYGLVQATEAAFGRTCLIYTYPWFWESRIYNVATKPSSALGEIAKRSLWIANYGVRKPIIPLPWTDYTIWQYSGDGGHVPGVKKDCDRDRFNGSEDDFQQWMSGL